MTDNSKAEKLARAVDNVRSGGRSFNRGLAAQISAELRAQAARIEQLEAALTLIRDHRESCHYHDEDMGHALRDFDIEDVCIMEFAARAALKGDGQ